MIDNGHEDNLKKEFVTASGRRFVSDAQRQFHYTSFETKKLLRAYSLDYPSPSIYKKASFVELEPHISYCRNKALLSFNIRDGATGASYVLKDISDFVTAIENKDTVSYGKHLTFTHDMAAFTEDTRNIIEFLKGYFREKTSLSYPYGKGHSKQLELTGVEIDDFFEAASYVYFLNTDFRSRYVEERLLEKSFAFPPIDLSIEKNETGITFECSAFTMIEGHSYVYFERRRQLHMLLRKDVEKILPFLDFLSTRRTENELFIADKDIVSFTTGLLPVLEEYLNVSYEGFDASRYLPDAPRFEIYLDRPMDYTITCEVKAIYNEGTSREAIFSVFESDIVSNSSDSGSDTDFIKRDYYLENKLANEVSPYFDNLDLKKGILYLTADEETDDRIYTFITRDIPILSQLCQVYLSENIKEINIRRSPRISFGVSVVSDLLELSIETEDIDRKELERILGRYNRKKKYYRLQNGDVLDLSSKEMDILFSMKDGLMLDKEDILSGHASIPRYRALFLEDIYNKSGEFEDIHISKSRAFKELLETFSSDFGSEDMIPKELSGVLRDYQKTGYYWLLTLKKNGFGGILADDMGLGKTIQVLALLSKLKEEALLNGEKRRCNLIVCPTSLVYNWQHEIKKFAPSLRCELAIGIKPDRVRITSEIDEEETDVIITSYDLLRRDIDLYKYIAFECMVIDEAQFIKNSSTLASKAVKSVKAMFKVALTGTPVENRLSELWSIFDFCMPGYLFNYKTFKQQIEIPVMTDGDTDEMDRLRRMIAPFVLRRLKKDVLKDLPDKLEENIFAQMTKEQEELYRAYHNRVRLMIKDKSDAEISRDRIAILSELTRLRQICCDPGLIYDNYDGGSAKADLVVEMIKSAAESGHKVLLFSQFTSMLDRLTKRLAKEEISYYLLTGATKKEDRISMVDAFSEDDTKVFCISLKAGGTGLNLTAADIVIHYDHWWNIAVQNQATDRAHRIGQKNVVTVYKLIMKDTVEERIIELQNKKKELSEKLLDEKSLSSPRLSKEELLEILG